MLSESNSIISGKLELSILSSGFSNLRYLDTRPGILSESITHLTGSS
jgi:hypothetical protein